MYGLERLHSVNAHLRCDVDNEALGLLRLNAMSYLSLSSNFIFIFSMCVLERTPRLMPDEGSMYYPRVQHYRELLDSLPMDAYTHGCILHPELTVDSMIPAYATTRIRSM